MNDRSNFVKRIYWFVSYIRWLGIGALHKIFKKYFLSKTKYAGCRYYGFEEAQSVIAGYIDSEEPFALGRTSFVEFTVLIKNQTKRLFGINTNRFNEKSNQLQDTLVSPGDDKDLFLGRYVDLMEKSINSVDIIAAFDCMHMCDAYLRECFDLSSKALVTDKSLEPFWSDDPWSGHLKGKKVLVVSPFSEEIRSQYMRRELIWDNPRVLPQFELITVDSVWYIGDSRDKRFATWFDALDYLYNEVMKHDFDIALLGCGKFGFPLASMIKEAGRKAIHMGGVLQILFGIKGKRWDNYINYNDYWIRPAVKVTQNDMKIMDNGDYW